MHREKNIKVMSSLREFVRFAVIEIPVRFSAFIHMFVSYLYEHCKNCSRQTEGKVVQSIR